MAAPAPSGWAWQGLAAPISIRDCCALIRRKKWFYVSCCSSLKDLFKRTRVAWIRLVAWVKPAAVSVQSQRVIPACPWAPWVWLCSPQGAAPSRGVSWPLFPSVSDGRWGQHPPSSGRAPAPAAAPAVASSERGGAVGLSTAARQGLAGTPGHHPAEAGAPRAGCSSAACSSPVPRPRPRPEPQTRVLLNQPCPGPACRSGRGRGGRRGHGSSTQRTWQQERTRRQHATQLRASPWPLHSPEPPSWVLPCDTSPGTRRRRGRSSSALRRGLRLPAAKQQVRAVLFYSLIPKERMLMPRAIRGGGRKRRGTVICPGSGVQVGGSGVLRGMDD